MDIVKDQQEITIGRYKCKVVNLYKDWWCACSGVDNSDAFTQFGITHEQIENLLGYTCSGSFPGCKSAKDLTKVIKFIMSKETTSQTINKSGVGRNYLIKLNNREQAFEIFDLLESLGEPINKTKFGYSSSMWFYIGFYTDTNEWTIADKSSTFGSNIISFKDFIDKYSTVKAFSKPVISLGSFPTDGCFRFDGVHNDDIIKHLKSTKPSAVELYPSHTFVAWNNFSYWFCQSSGKTEYNWEQLAKFVTNKVNMQEIQEECKRKFPIGCSYHSPGDITRRSLMDDSKTYTIFSDMIYAHAGGGCLYDNGSYATIYSLPEEKPFKSRFKIGDWIMWDGSTKSGPYKLTSVKKTGFLDQNDDYRDTEDYNYRLATRSEIPEVILDRDIPEYVECISNDFIAIKLGIIYKLEPKSTINSYYLKDVNMGSYSPNHFKPSTKEAYDVQFTTLYDGCSKGIESLIEKEIDSIYQVGYDDYYKPKTKPLIEDVQSVSVKLSTKRKINNKFKI
jgi:hypothetical protein